MTMGLLDVASIVCMIVVLLSLGYWVVLLVASFRQPPPLELEPSPRTRFAVAIPAHDEEGVIGRSVDELMRQGYPRDRFQVHVVADHCTDGTAAAARQAGAAVHERNTGPREGKGAALSWLFARILTDHTIDAVVVFDADSIVDPQFLRLMDYHISRGATAIQGHHAIRNRRDGWFASLTWAMFLVDNRVQNQGRTNLGLSAKNMGDAFCIRADVLRQTGWGEGLTEDYEMRQRLLLSGQRILYEPRAVAYGEAVASFSAARMQRQRWIRGARDASKLHRWELVCAGIRRRSGALVEGALQSTVPSYSTLSLLSLLGLLLHLEELLLSSEPVLDNPFAIAWVGLFAICGLYPYLGLVADRAPAASYLAISLGFVYIGWRTWIALVTRFQRVPVLWQRTPHGQSPGGDAG